MTKFNGHLYGGHAPLTPYRTTHTPAECVYMFTHTYAVVHAVALSGNEVYLYS